MTWHTDDRRLYWEQRRLDAAQEDARRKMEERKTAPAVTPEQIARGLTKAQREAVMSASRSFGGAMQVWHSHRGTIKSIHKKGLCSDPDYKNCATESPLGLAVRAELERIADE